jgi:hypothetical protein
MVNKVMKRKYIIGLFVLLAMATVSTYAWSVDSSLSNEPSQVYVTSAASTSATITNFSSRPLGKNKILIQFTLAGTATEMNCSFIDSEGYIVNVDDTAVVQMGAPGALSTISETGDYDFGKATVAAGSYQIVLTGSGIVSRIGVTTKAGGAAKPYSGIVLSFK